VHGLDVLEEGDSSRSGLVVIIHRRLLFYYRDGRLLLLGCLELRYYFLH